MGQPAPDAPPRELEIPDGPDGPDPEVLATLDPPGRRRGLWVGLALGAVGLLAVAGTAWALMSNGAVTYETVVPQPGPLVLGVTAVGQLEPLDSVEIGSDLSGRLQSVTVRTNDQVAAGQELARLDPEPFENAVAQAKGQVASARAALAQAQVNLKSAQRDSERLTRLVQVGAATQAETDNAAFSVQVQQAAVASARAQLDQARASLAKAEDDLQDSVIVSPIDGVVTQRYVDPGQTVVSAMSATPLFEIASDLSVMKAEVGVDEADIGSVHDGQSATFTVSAWPDRTFDAQVQSVAIAPDPDESVVVYNAELRLDNADLSLRPGMTATAVIETGRVEQGLVVPAEALSYLPANQADPGDETMVWLLVAGRPQRVEVQVLGEDGALVAVGGLSADAVVIVDDDGES